MRECYLPKFQYHRDGLTALQVWQLFTKQFRFLPDCTCEPALLAKMVQRLIYNQQRLRITIPSCPRHEVRMVMLGKFGITYIRPKQKLLVNTLNVVGNGGMIAVANGILRCPSPGCFVVAPIEDGGTMRA